MSAPTSEPEMAQTSALTADDITAAQSQMSLKTRAEPIMVFFVTLTSFAGMLIDILWTQTVRWYTLSYAVIIVAAGSGMSTSSFLWTLGAVSVFQILAAAYQMREHVSWMAFPAVNMAISVGYLIYIALQLSLESLSLENHA